MACTVSLPVPRLSNWAVTSPVALCITVIRAMMAITPMMMPSTVRKERILLPRMLANDMRRLSLSIVLRPLGKHAVQNAHQPGGVLRNMAVVAVIMMMVRPSSCSSWNRSIT